MIQPLVLEWLCARRPIGPALTVLAEHFIVMNGDILTDMDYAAMLTEHATPV